MRPSILTMACALLVAVFATLFVVQVQAAPIYADSIYTGGNIITVNELQPEAKAVASRPNVRLCFYLGDGFGVS